MRARRVLPLAAVVAGAVACPFLLPGPAAAEPTDGALTVVVVRDADGDGGYNAAVDVPQPGIQVVVRDAGGAKVEGVTNADGKFEVSPSDALVGGHYFVIAEIPADQSGLVPVPPSESFTSMSTSVDLSSGDVVVRMGVQAGTIPPAMATETSPGQPPRPSDDRRFAVGDRVWRDTDRSGRQDAGEPGEGGISVQLLDAGGDVVDSTVTAADGTYVLDGLRAGTYSLRFSGVPNGFRLAPPAPGAPDADSDADFTGVTPPFVLGVGEPGTRPAVPEDGVHAAYVNSTVDAGITPIRYAVADRVWTDLNGDGIAQADEPAGAARVTLIGSDGSVLATTQTDAEGRYLLSGLRGGHYQLRFEDLPAHRAITRRGAGSDSTADSDPDPVTGLTRHFTLSQGAPNVRPATDQLDPTVDFIATGLGAGLVGSYSLGDEVWLDADGNGIRDPADGGVRRVRVELVGTSGDVLARTTTSRTGGFAFHGLRGGAYRLRFSRVPEGLIFTGQRRGTDPATDSDADLSGMTPAVILSDDHPADTATDAGLTVRGNAGAVQATTPEAPLVSPQQPPRGEPSPLVVIGSLVFAPAGLAVLRFVRHLWG